MLENIEAALGIKFAHLIAGVAGGTVRAFIAGGSYLQATASVICGSLTAAYLTSPVYQGATYYFPFLREDRSSEYACGYLVGLTAMFIAEGVLRAVKRWAKDPVLPTPS